MRVALLLLAAIAVGRCCTSCEAGRAPGSARTGGPPAHSGPTPQGSGRVPSSLRSVARSELCVTQGAIEVHPSGRLLVIRAKMRAVLAAATPAIAELRFTYRGPVLDAEPLRSGQLRRQIGLKLRAQDACNVIYVMWRIEPESRLVVSIKRNPGLRTSRECGNEGYTNVTPRHATPVPALSPGAAHTLRAAMDADALRVFVDGALVWEGALGPDALSFDGPVGVRTDNGLFELDLLVASAAGSPCGGASPEEPE